MLRSPYCRKRLQRGLFLHRRIIPPQFPLRCCLVVLREVAQVEEGEHLVAEIVRIHRPAQLVGDAPESIAQLLLVGVAHQEKVISHQSSAKSW